MAIVATGPQERGACERVVEPHGGGGRQGTEPDEVVKLGRVIRVTELQS